MTMDRSRYTVTSTACFRCGACSTLAPFTFAMGPQSAVVRRSPRTAAERALAEAARFNCPAHAIGTAAVEDTEDDAETLDVPQAPERSLFARLFDEAERVRWTLHDIPWDDIDRDAAPPALLRFVRQAALSELTTFSATRRFLQDMAGDTDFSEWISVWFYEETKHPEVLWRYLACFDQAPERATVLRSRVAAPFMKSQTGMLVMNVVSEIVAATSYEALAHYTREPVLKRIARKLAGDEARHAASFYSFARKAIERAEKPDTERREAVKVLYYWVSARDRVEHPVNQFYDHIRHDPELVELAQAISTDHAPVRARVCKVIGTLVGAPLQEPDDVLACLRNGIEYDRATEPPR